MRVTKEDLAVFTIDQLLQILRIFRVKGVSRQTTKAALLDRLCEAIRQHPEELRVFHLEHIA